MRPGSTVANLETRLVPNGGNTSSKQVQGGVKKTRFELTRAEIEGMPLEPD